MKKIKQMISKHLVMSFLITIIGLLGASGLFLKSGYPKNHDSIPHMARIFNMQEAINDGQLPPIWGGRLMGGIGSPTMMLNYQLPYYPILALMKYNVKPDDAYKIVLYTTYILSGLAAYWALSHRYDPLSSFVGSTLYLMAPYRFVDIYVRGAIGECVAFLFVPLALGAYFKKQYILLVFSLAFLFLSHPVGSMLFMILFGGQLLIDVFTKKSYIEIAKTAVVFFVAVALSAYNLMPTLALTKYTHYSPENSDTLRQFPTVKQLIYSKWGYGVSTFDDQDGMSFQVGIAQWTVLFLSLVALLVIKKKKKLGIEIYYFAVSIFAIFMMTVYSVPIYQLLNLKSVIDFPWRILMLVVFAISFLAAFLIDKMKGNLKHFVAWGLVLLAIIGNRNHFRIDDVWRVPVRQFEYDTGDAYGEYAAKTRVTRDMSDFGKRYQLVSGEARIEEISNKSNEYKVKVTGNNDSVVRLNIMYFPGWEVAIDEQKVEIADSETDQAICYVTKRKSERIDDSGLIECRLSGNEQVVQARYVPLPVQVVSNIISILAFGGIIIWQLLVSFSRRITKKTQ